MTRAGRRPARIKCGILPVSESEVPILNADGAYSTLFLPFNGTRNLLAPYGAAILSTFRRNPFIILPVPDLAAVRVFLHQSACQR